MIFLSSYQRRNLALMVYYALPDYYLSMCGHFHITGLPNEADLRATVKKTTKSSGVKEPQVVNHLISIPRIAKEDKLHYRVARALWTIIDHPRRTDIIANDQTPTTVPQFERIAKYMRMANKIGDDSLLEICKDAIEFDRIHNASMPKSNILLRNTWKLYAGIEL